MSQIVNGKLQTPQGAPSSLTFNLPSSMVNCSKYEQRVMPYGTGVFTVDGQTPKFVIPRVDRAFMNTETAYITGEVTLAGSFATADGTHLNYVLGTYYSMFSRWSVTANGNTIDSIEKPSELVNMLLNMTLNPAEKKGLSNSLGYYNDVVTQGEGDATFNICQPINTGNSSAVLLTGGGKTFTFALPLIGVLNASKMLPLFISDHTIELTINRITNWLTGMSDNAVAAVPGIAFTMSKMELVYDQLLFTPESFASIMAPYPEKLYIKSSSYDFGAGQSFPVSTSAIDIPVSIKRSSLKTAFIYFVQDNAIDKTYGGVNPNLTDICFITNGQNIPQRPLNCQNPSEIYNQVQKSFGSLYSNSHSGSCGKMEFCRRTTGNTKYYDALTTATVGNIRVAANKFYIAIDCETVNYDSQSLYSGIPMGVNSNFRINIGDTYQYTSPAVMVNCTPYYWMHYDSIIEYDLLNGIVSVIA